MEIKQLVATSTTATFEVINSTCYFSDVCYDVYINDRIIIKNEKRNIFSLYNLIPNTVYKLNIVFQNTYFKIKHLFSTINEVICLKVKQFGAVGDGIHDDTKAIQTAIMSCPKGGRVLIESGTYYVTPLYLKSDITIELQKGAVLLGSIDRTKYSILPKDGSSEKEKIENYIGSWEGEPANVFASLITGLYINNVNIVGEGIIDGNAQNSDWWENPKKMRIAWRPKLIYLNHCKNIVIQGITLTNSPSWTLHPNFSDNLDIIDLKIVNPKDSPNTDGIDPESCQQVNIVGVDFSVGDDCVAIKSGKLMMGSKFTRPSKNIFIRNCRMRYGHGAVVLGSEMSGGIMNVYVSQCLFINTDRGLRIKTRRGRGIKAIIDQIYFKNIKMIGVMTPFVMNMYYSCDIDGKTEYVWSKKPLPLDEGTPSLKHFVFEDIYCKDTSVAAGYIYGLPEKKIESVYFKNVFVGFKEEETYGVPAMMSFIEPVSKMGLYFNQVKEVVFNNVNIEGQKGNPINLIEVDSFFNEVQSEGGKTNEKSSCRNIH